MRRSSGLPTDCSLRVVAENELAAMKLKPHQHRKADQNLKKLAELATNPDDRQYLLGTAKLFDGLADRAEQKAPHAIDSR